MVISLVSHMALRTLAAVQRSSKSFGPTSCLRCMLANEVRSGMESSMPVKPAAARALIFCGRVWSSRQPILQVANETGIPFKDESERDIVTSAERFMSCTVILPSEDITRNPDTLKQFDLLRMTLKYSSGSSGRGPPWSGSSAVRLGNSTTFTVHNILKNFSKCYTSICDWGFSSITMTIATCIKMNCEIVRECQHEL